MRRRASADEARLAGDEAEMLLAADPLRLTQGENTLVDLRASRLRQCDSGHFWVTWSIGSAFRFDEGDGALLEVAYELRRYP